MDGIGLALAGTFVSAAICGNENPSSGLLK